MFLFAAHCHTLCLGLNNFHFLATL